MTSGATPRPWLRQLRDLALLPAISIMLALLVGAVLMILSSPLINGFDPLLPLTAYRALALGAFTGNGLKFAAA